MVAAASAEVDGALQYEAAARSSSCTPTPTGALPAGVLSGYFTIYQTLQAKLVNALALSVHFWFLIFPALVAVAGALLLTHSHSLGNIKEEVLAELSES